MEASVTGYFAEIWKLRHFWTALVRIDLRRRYRGSAIGMGWSLLHPIAMTTVLCLVFFQMFHLDLRTYAPSVLVGLTFWGFVMASVVEGCQCFFHAESYIRQHKAPLAIYALRTTLAAGFHFLPGFAVALILVWCLRGFGNLAVLPSLVPTFALLFVVGWSLAICLGVANVMFQDSQHLLEVVMQIMFYLTPIMYTPEQLSGQPWLARIVYLNPLAAMLELIRRPLLEGRLPTAPMVLAASLAGLALAGAAALALWRFEKRLIFYL